MLSGGQAKQSSIPAGTRVSVRRFNIREKQWMPWISGRVIGHRVERFHVGSELDLYDVETNIAGGYKSVDTYIPFLGEMKDDYVYRPSDNVKDMLTKVADLKKVFAFLQIPGTNTAAWMPAIVISRRVEPVNRVSVLAGPLRGQTSVASPHILPYNAETAEAIKNTGQSIYWENGTD